MGLRGGAPLELLGLSHYGWAVWKGWEHTQTAVPEVSPTKQLSGVQVALKLRAAGHAKLSPGDPAKTN